MTTEMNSRPETAGSPVFIHSMFRAGSTYLFNVFRRSEKGFWCYQEPENEFLMRLNGDADELLQMGNDTVSSLRHPALSRPYFWEFHQKKDALAGLFRKSFSYDDFFAGSPSGLSQDQRNYFGALIAHADGRPVLQFCRSAGRIGMLKETFGGIHIHLWREPRNQWWSFKVNGYFDAAVQLIYNARALPPLMEEAKLRCGIAEFHSEDVEVEFAHARAHPLAAIQSYYAFYVLWLYAFLQGERYGDITINIDRLSLDQAYRDKTLQGLKQLGINALDFSDCSVPRAVFMEDEAQFFRKTENDVRGLFLSYGDDKSSLDEAGAAHESVLNIPGGEAADPLRDAARARRVALHYLDSLAPAETRATQAEARATEAETRATQAETRATEAETRATQAETRATQAEARATQAETRATEAETRATRLQADLDAAQAEGHRCRGLADECEQRLQTIVHSRSWRITKPLRWLGL